ncbi:protein kinase Wee90 [Trypanosoma rangeli]|uniref:Protein kinase Wee90 n=1 Tax=Trypanosoma rangeli TaxID=5698 RepID=A0A3R7RC77_TRYRA|nr:protein kinase Wee90 [Trypanosoma rangeli]RNE99573.1 protein kinase Wee90 [Trypanosoma rangeli]|eukprot:RNE99573.1 protein kinase Wee90 [Trypanosoma rangeli]
MGTLAPPFTALEADNSVVNRDDLSTPLAVPQNSALWRPPPVPKTPAKQRRTVHRTRSQMRCAPLNNSQRGPRNAVQDIRKGLASRKRPSSDLSQFSALQLDDTDNSMPIISQDGEVEVPRRCVNRPVAPLGFFSAAVLFPSQTISSQGDCLPRRGQSASFIRASPEGLDHSQADTEYSNLFNRRILTDYREIKDLGSGSFGKVTLYEETGTGALVAVKMSPPLTNAEQRQRFLREKEILTFTRGFPHVVQLLDAWEEGSIPQMYLQMEYCKGGSVANMAELRRKRGERWEERELFIFLGHMALALDALHSANIVHLDFKPDNVLIDGDGSYKLSDFGCSVTLNEEGRPRRCLIPGNQRTSNASQMVNGNTMMDLIGLSMPTQLSTMSVEEGDCRYVCADMLNQKRHPKAGDIFSFGISLFELMSGEALPQHGTPFLELRSELPVELLESRGYSRPLIDLVALLMHNDPVARPTARDVLRFFYLPPRVPELVTKWSAAEETCESEEASTLLEMRFVHTALEVSLWLVGAARRTLEGASLNNNNNNGGGGGSSGGNCATGGDALWRRPRVDIEESCTPKTPVIIRRLGRS